ncbi:LysR family transcriptional regulator [Pseudomonas sp. dw_612]|uniref:LysR substrate-binding domain-containing protein n=1 Tax=Pseudomonas sp. dw_612 TaxID=2720080 RepID=UPI001BD46811|nr:LysR family transcriptional regulator [Pseudomonas sp. dw_612]
MDMFQAMQIYTQVVDTGSFKNAADALQLHRPAITKAIQQLEKTLEVRLLNRTTRKISMTAEGERFYEQCSKILGDVASTLATFSHDAESPKGKLRLDLPVTLAKAVIIPALPAFRARYPDIELVVGCGDQAVDMINEGIDCVVRLGELSDSSSIARRIGAVPMLTCASPAYLAREGTPTQLSDLNRHLAVNYFSGPTRKIMDWQFVIDGETVLIRLKSGIQVNDSEAFLACGLAGLGLVHGLQLSLQPFLDSGELVAVLPQLQALPKPISVLYPNKRYLAPKVRVFIDWLSELLQHQGLA